jgi:hypothetical protein
LIKIIKKLEIEIKQRAKKPYFEVVMSGAIQNKSSFGMSSK